jgi:hypothetical protein
MSKSETLAYAGIGSRLTPTHICDNMTTIARELWSLGCTLRSGAAAGADSAFERGANTRKEIYRLHDVTDEALELAARFHPKWDRCSEHARLLLARNGFQILGPDLQSPSKFVVCWTCDGKASGGTGQAMRIADAYGITIYNLHDIAAGYRALVDDILMLNDR